MKAEDTVMHLDDIDEGRMSDSYASLRKALEKQAEISFKAGIKEVTQWVKYVGLQNNDPLGRLLIGGREWQAKLKEWGLE